MCLSSFLYEKSIDKFYILISIFKNKLNLKKLNQIREEKRRFKGKIKLIKLEPFNFYLFLSYML